MSRLRLREAPLTEALTAALVAAHLLFLLTGSLTDAVLEAALVPARITGVMPAGVVPALLTPVSSAFLHANLLHLGFNLLLLVFCGLQVEPVLGSGRTAILLTIGAYGAAAAEVALHPSLPEPVIGASGALSALIAAYALYFGPQRGRAFGPISAATVRALWLGAAWVALNVAQAWAFGTIGTGIAVGEHIGGFAVGLLLARPLLRHRIRRD